MKKANESMGGWMLRSFYKIEIEIMKATQVHTEGSAFHSADEDGLVCTFE